MTSPLPDRIDAMTAAGGAWLSGAETLALASSSAPDAQLIASTRALTQAAQQQPQAVPSSAYDSTDLAPVNSNESFVSTVHAIAGTPAFTDTGLGAIQQELTRQGYGEGSANDGVWTATDQANYDRWLYDQTQAASAGQGKPATIPTKSAIGDFLSAISPHNALNAAAGFVKSLPGDVRDLGADTSGAVGGLTSYVGREAIGAVTGTDYSDSGQASILAQAHADAYAAGARTSGLLTRVGTLGTEGGPTLQQYKDQFTDADGGMDVGKIVGRSLQNLSTALAFVPIAKGATASLTAARGIGEEGAASALTSALTPSSEMALRTPGPLTKALITTSGRVSGEEGKQFVTRGLLSRAAGANIPVLKQFAPVLRAADGAAAKVLGTKAGEDGLAAGPNWYRLRTTLASPYRVPIVADAGTLFQRGIGLGALARGDAAIQTKLGVDPNDAFVSSIRGSYIDPYDVRIAALQRFGLEDPLNDLGLILHGPVRDGAGTDMAHGGNAEAFGKLSSGLVKAMTVVTGGPSGILGDYQQAIRETTGVHKSLEEMVDDAGGEDNLAEHLNGQATEMSAQWQAQRDLVNANANDEPVPPNDGGTEARLWLRQRANDVATDPDRSAKALSDWSQADSQPLISFVKSMVNSNDQMDFQRGKGNLAQFIDANRALRAVLQHPELRAELGTPEMISAVQTANAQTAQKITDLEEPDFATDEQKATASTAQDQLRSAPKATPSAQFGVDNMLNQAKGQFGLARKDTWTKRTMTTYQNQFTSAVAKLNEQASHLDPEKDAGRLAGIQMQIDALNHDAVNTLSREADYDGAQLDKLFSSADANTTAEGINKALEQAKSMLAADVFPPADASAEVRAMFARADESGYKVVAGQGIGHLAEMPADYTLRGNALTVRRKVANVLGLSPNRISQLGAAELKQARAKLLISEAIHTGAIRPYSDHYNANTILHVLGESRRDEDSGVQLASASRTDDLALGAAKVVGTRQRDARNILRGQGLATTPENVAKTLEDQRQALISRMGLRDMPMSVTKNILTDGSRVPYVSGKFQSPIDVGMMSEADAEKVHDLLIKSYTAGGTYVLGAQHYEDMLRSGMGILGSTFAYDPGKALSEARFNPIANGVGHLLGAAPKLNSLVSHVTLGMGRLPNNYYKLALRLRYQLSPYFDLRRLVKTNLKMAAAGLRPAAEPARALYSEGGSEAWNNAHALVNKMYPESANPFLDDNDRLLVQSGVFSLYNPRHFMAWQAHQLSQQGMSIPQMRSTIDKLMGYGNRTAMERTTNTVFFPFSFDKTLYRAVGGYLLDHPAQALVMLRGFQHYDDWSQHNQDDPAAYTWWQQHAPIFNEFTRFNAFSHGVGPGEFGGITGSISRPLLQAFMPSSIPSTKASNSMLKEYLPVLSDFSRVYGEFQQTKNNAITAIKNSKVDTEQLLGDGAPVGLNGPARAVSGSYALDDSLTFQRQLKKSLAPILIYNRAHPDSKQDWPNTDLVPDTVRGQPINSSTIGMVVAHRYPSYNPTVAIQEAEKSKDELTAYLGTHVNDPNLANLEQFTKDVNELQTKIADGTTDEKTLAAYSESLRTYAKAQGPGFVPAYKQFFQHVLGPLDIKDVTP